MSLAAWSEFLLPLYDEARPDVFRPGKVRPDEGHRDEVRPDEGLAEEIRPDEGRTELRGPAKIQQTVV